MRVLIADDHKIVRDGLRLLLDSEPDVEIVAEAETGRETLELIAESSPDVVLLDLRMPDMDGYEVLDAVGEMEHPPGIVVLTMNDDLAFVRRAIQLGADGFLVKSVGRDELIRALRSVQDGTPYIQDQLTRPLVASLGDGQSQADLTVSLSERQLNVLEALARGMENAEIGQELAISESTVKAELRSLYAELDVKNRSQAVAIGFRLGVLT
jgi:NarL family two-component system response regulator YdfI